MRNTTKLMPYLQYRMCLATMRGVYKPVDCRTVAAIKCLLYRPATVRAYLCCAGVGAYGSAPTVNLLMADLRGVNNARMVQ